MSSQLSQQLDPDFVPGHELLFVPLGGAGEIGMNLNLYGCDGHWLMVDCGIGFGDDTTPGVDIMMPDPGFILGQVDRLSGLVLTHAHEDHFGAIPYFWDQLGCPVFATPFAAAVLRRKLQAAPDAPKVDIREIPCGGCFDIGPFGLRYVGLTHSIPEAQAVMIRTGYGTALHTGDWKLDDTPLSGPATDIDALRQCGAEGVDALICDSTNIMSEHSAGSENEVRENLISLVSDYQDVRVAATCFASNIARLESLALAAAENGRAAVLVGRSLHRFSQAARECGYLRDVPPLMGEDDLSEIPRDKALLICTGCQGEPQAALSRIATGYHPAVTLSSGDVVIFSSRVIPGNEQAVARTQNRLVAAGVEVVTGKHHMIHVSGHPGRSDLEKMYQWLNPGVVIPVHGEARHLRQQACFAQECGLPASVVAENGTVVRLAPGGAGPVGSVSSGRLARHGDRLIPLESEILRQRKKIMYNGSVFLAVTLDQAGSLLSDPVLSVPGLLDPNRDGEFIDDLAESVAEAIENLSDQQACDDQEIVQVARKVMRRGFRSGIGLRPWIEVQVIRLDQAYLPKH